MNADHHHGGYAKNPSGRRQHASASEDLCITSRCACLALWLAAHNAGQLNFYVSVVNDKIRLAGQRPAVGILVCGSKNQHTVRYAPDGAAQPLAAASCTYEALPQAEQPALSSPEAIDSALDLDND